MKVTGWRNNKYGLTAGEHVSADLAPASRTASPSTGFDLTALL
jgi:hypothetical protein